MPELPDPVTFAIPAFVGLIVVEMLFVRFTGRGRYEPRDTLTSLMMGLGNTISGVLFGFLAFGWSMFVYQFALFDIGFAWWAFAIAFIGDDFLYYWWHRASHRVRWFWAAHVIHHSSQHYNLSTALRQTWTGQLTFSFIIFGTPLALLGFHPAIIAFVSGLNLIYQFWIHTEAVKRFPPWFEAVMNTPSHHRVHHATNPRYLDSNYAGVFIVWDRMFGTFEPERDDEPCRYGIVRNLGTFNPLKVAFHEWYGIGKDVASARSVGHAFGYAFRPPGWSPDGSRDTSETIKARWKESLARKGGIKAPRDEDARNDAQAPPMGGETNVPA
ncbi:MAG: sterol desaturase family protein [Euryhalocaulis sp.]|uniref:sterol desaturase family protein n=1 Tax=Euryhalocaulis sp. TaxID=2744307 RepID=UPI0018018F98|nr:sterol desaturase family protein [Euryhalocaulis sp.]MBA4802883.1 sterol desaturase family protein [Euryhalocaulis sp.]